MNNNKYIVILGAGESGVGAAILAKKQGAKVFVSDKSLIKEKYKKELEELNIDFEEGLHSEEKILNADLIIKSPGIPDKAPLIIKLKENGISTLIHYPVPVHFQPAYADLGYTAGSLPFTERASREVLSLPLYPELTEEKVVRVCQTILDFFTHSM